MDPTHADAAATQFDAMVRGLVEGEDAAYAEFWERYGKRLHGIAQNKFPTALKRRLEPEDLVQSVCRSFFRRATAGQLELSHAESLWRLLCAITLNKIKMKLRFHYAQRRDVTRESDMTNEPRGSDSDAPFEPADTGQSPDAALMFAEQLQHVMSMLDAAEQEILQLKLEEFNNDEIAAKVGRSERTVRRTLNRVKEKLEAMLPDWLNSSVRKI
jgi:RNA polymerase sigma-70 factor (ECF subfamily)